MADGTKGNDDLDHLEERIEDTREAAEDAEHPLINDEGQPYHEKGSIGRDVVDETIVPPG